MSPDLREYARGLREVGLPVRLIAEEFGVHIGTIYRVLAGVPKRSERRAEVRRAYLEAEPPMTVKALALRFNIPEHRARAAVRGLPRRAPDGRKRMPPELVEEIIFAASVGTPMREIARASGFAVTSICRRLARLPWPNFRELGVVRRSGAVAIRDCAERLAGQSKLVRE